MKANFSKHISTELLYGNNILLYIFNVADITIYGLKFNWQKNPYSKWYYGFGIYLDREVFGNYSNYFVDNNVSLFYLLIPTINRKIIIDKDNDFIISAGISAMFGQKVRGINEPYYTLLGIPELDFCYIFKF